MVARYPSNNVSPAPGRPLPRPAPRRPDSPRPRGVPSGPGRGYSYPLPDLPPGTRLAAGLLLKRVAPRLVPGLNIVLGVLDVMDFFNWATRSGGVNPAKYTESACMGTCSGEPIVQPPQVFAVTGGTCCIRRTPEQIAAAPVVGSPSSFSGFGPEGNYGGLQSRRVIAYYTKKGGLVDPLPNFVPGRALPLPSSPSIPSDFPLANPLARPQPRPQPTPRDRREPGEEPSQPKRDPSRRPPEPNPVYRHPPLPTPLVSVSPEVTKVIDVLPNDVVITQPPSSNQPPVVVVDNSNPASPTPPAKGTVQRKVNVAIVGGVVWTGINTVTEAFDFILAMHDSLPKHMQLSKKASKRQKLLYMTTNFDVWKSIDAAEAIENYINMQIGDYISAYGSEWTKKLAQLTGNLTGVDRALAQHESRIFDATGRSRADFTPTLDIDMDSGRVTLTWAGYPIVVYSK